MKLKSLFLATLAAMAMASCSNDNDPIENGAQEKDAVFNFSIAMPKAATTKVTTDPGTEDESTVSSITLVLKYTNSNIPDFSKTYNDINAAFTFNTTPTTDNKYIYTLKSAELVAPGDAIAYVYVNGNAETELTTTTGFLTTYATADHFYMTGSNGIKIEEHESNNVSVEVNRVAVKLEEMTDADEGTDGRQSQFEATAKTQTNVAKLYLNLEDYTFSNLNKKSNALGTIFQPETASTETYFNYFAEDETEDRWGTAFKETKKFADNITYCFENGTTPATTQIWYKAKVSATFSDGQTTENLETFYVYNNVLYKNFTELNNAFNGILNQAPLNLSATSTNEEMARVGVKKYTEGYCYYFHNISTDGSILRNNWYRLKVTGITDLGLPEIDPKTPDTPTMLTFDVTVLPWTVHENSFVLGGETPQQ